MTRDPKEQLEVEDPAVEVLTKHLGWIEIDNKETEEMRGSLKEVVLVPILQKAIKRLNPWISEENTHRVIRNITQIQASSVLEANEKIQGMMEKGTTVMQDIHDGMDNKSRDVHLIDYDKPGQNDFNVVRQFRVLHYKENRPDIVLFINGLPIVVIECKSPTLRNPMAEGMLQMFRYQETEDKFRNVGCPKLFTTAQILVSTYKDQTKYATNFTQERHWSEWVKPYPLTLDELQSNLGRLPSSQDIFLFSVCNKNTLLDIIQNFIVYEREKGKVIKKLCKYQQYRAVNKLILNLIKRKSTRGGVIWHTQGSGKSLTMLWTAVKLRRIKELQNPTILIVTDRTDLDDQIEGTFTRCGFSNPIQSKSAKHLKELLSDPVGQTIMTTIQKFQDAADEYPTLTENSNIFCLNDEAHRTQYKMLAANMRKAIMNGTFIGFTGTPISRKFRNTIDTFGSYVDVYDHKQAVLDGATVPIYYESRLPELSISGGSTMDQLFDRIFKEYSPKEREKIKQKYATPEAIAISSQRIKMICLDILDHYEKFIAPNDFKAQIVTCSREAAVKYKLILEELGAPKNEVLISKNHNDVEALVPYHKSKTEEQEIIRQFKEEKDPRIIIVCDKLLTGFDAPVEQVMYLDSPLKEHTLLQAIARVNRTNLNKTYGLVVDYWGISQELQDALDMFTVEESEGIININIKKEVLPRLQAAHNAAMNFFRDVNIQDVEECVKYLEPEDRRSAFDYKFKLFTSYLDMLLPDPAALPFVKDLKWLAEIRARARNRYRDEQLTLDECSEKVKKLIEDYIKAEGIVHLIAPTSIFSKRFDEEIKKLTSDEAKASEIEHAVKHEITFKIHEDPVFYETLKERIERILRDFKEGRINAAKQLELLQVVLEDMRHPEQQAQKQGLDPEIAPFYNLLNTEAPTGGVVREKGVEYGKDNALEELSKKIFDALDKLAVVDWELKEDVKREMRKAIKRILREANYQEDIIESTALKVMDLARARFVR
jgi:type I restriction enzyme R subunit